MGDGGCHGYSLSTNCQLGPRTVHEQAHLAVQRLKKLLLSNSMIHAVTEISPTLTKHEKCSALVGMQCNTFSICGTRSLSWVSVACWSQGLGQLTGLQLVPEAMPGERRTCRESESK